MCDTTPEPRKGRLRRIVKWTTSSVGAVVLLLANYIALWCCYLWDGGRDNVVIRNVPWSSFEPLEEYAFYSDRPGSDTLCTLSYWSGNGGLFSWEFSEAQMLCYKHAECHGLLELLKAEVMSFEEAEEDLPDFDSY